MKEMKIVVLDGYTENPGDLSWDALHQLGDCTVWERTAQNQIVERAAEAEICGCACHWLQHNRP